MSCQPHRVTSGQSNSGHKQIHISKLFSHIMSTLCQELKAFLFSHLNGPFHKPRQTIPATINFVCVNVYICAWTVWAGALSFCFAKRFVPYNGNHSLCSIRANHYYYYLDNWSAYALSTISVISGQNNMWQTESLSTQVQNISKCVTLKYTTKHAYTKTNFQRVGTFDAVLVKS